ncbi:MAG: PIN domain-containing protein [Chloroflexota bacterium]
MTRKRLRVFLDTSALFSAVLSNTGGARELFRLGEAGLLDLAVGPNVLREADEVVRRKAPASLPTLARLLAAGGVQSGPTAKAEQIESARGLAAYEPDARVLAEAMQSGADWFVTHDKEHFLSVKTAVRLPFEIGTPGDLLQRFKDELTLS